MEKIQQKWLFNQPPQEIWDYLTKPELIEQWLMKTDFKPIVGHKFQFESHPDDDCQYGGITHCEVLEIIPLQKLSYSWKSGNESIESSIDSVVVWTLTEKNGGTELQLQHSGFKLLAAYTSHKNGWSQFVNGLIELLNTFKK